MMLTPGTTAPAFTLPNALYNSVSLGDYTKEWVLLYFYPQDDTPGCATEACAFRDNFPFYEDLHIQVIGISKDNPESHKAFKEKYDLPFELLSDEESKVITLYGANTEETKRISYLIDPDGIIQKVYVVTNPALHAEEVLVDLKSLQS